MDSNASDYQNGIQFVDKMLHENDLKGAIHFARRVKTSSRKLKRLSQFLANIVVQVSSEDEETDWYTVLGVDPSADVETMKIHYMQLVKQIRQIGSSEAYKLLDKAWITLSNKFTRKDYDLRRRSREESQQNPLSVRQESSATDPLSVRQESSATDNVAHALENVNNHVVNDQRNDFTDQGEINAIDWESIWNPQVNDAPHEPLDTLAIACPSLHYESQQNPLAERHDETSATENVSHALENVNNTVVSDQGDDFTDEREINTMDWDSIWNPQANYASSEPLDTFLIVCPSCYHESYRVCLISKSDCPQCGKVFAALEVPSPDAKHKEGMSLVEDSGDTIKNVQENHMPVGSDGQRGAYLCQTGCSQAENVGSSKSSKVNGKRFSDLERNSSMKKAKNENLNKLHERNVAATDQTQHNAAPTEGPGPEDRSKTTEVPDLDLHDFDRNRTQESENQLNAVYDEMMDYFGYLPDL